MTVHPLLTDLTAYTQLREHAAILQHTSLERLFAEDAGRAQTFTVSAAGLRLDYAKHLLSASALSSLLRLAQQTDITAAIANLFNGVDVNNTENRPALHTLLRATHAGSQSARFLEVTKARERMKAFAQRIHSGQHTGFSGAAISDVVNIGIGGSDLGPRLVTQALKPYWGQVSCHHVANVDPSDLDDALSNLNPATTAFIICSKSFRTQETLANGLAARAWMLEAGATSADLNKHFLAVTTNISAAEEFGIPADHCLPMWDWVGGRYSVWSGVGLSCAIAVGWNHFEEFLAGAEAMDEHFRNTPAADNMPLLMSLLELWNCNFLGASTHAVLPYDHNLRQLPEYLQQLTMESNGKRVSRQGERLSYATAPVLWGAAGTIGQHSFHQLLHQGTALCPVDFILPLSGHTAAKEQHRMLVANCLAQSRTLMMGRSLEAATKSLLQRGIDEQQAAALAPHLVMPGNRPSSIITMQSLTPATLGALLALYEHRTYCSGHLWGINSFDQWGVELGKEIGTEILEQLSITDRTAIMDAATQRLIDEWRNAQN
jgi:glucose-6-phosphate isomerase